MTKEDKELLLRDLCARLPYGVKCQVNAHTERLDSIDPFEEAATFGFQSFDVSEVKPYLRSISSMTDEEVDKLFKILKVNEDNGKEWIKINDVGIIRLFTEEGKDFYEIANAMDYLNSIHIDYRLLISKGLALEATEDMLKNNNQN